MIKTKEELKKVLEIEKKLYLGKGKKTVELILVKDKDWFIYRFQRFLRLSEYHYNNRYNLFHKLLYIYYRRKKNILGNKLGIEMWENTFGPGLRIWHAGAIVVNGYSKVGAYCQLRGDNCIGVDGNHPNAPVIGDNVILGNGAKVIGDICIQDDTVVGAGAVVVKSSKIKGDVLVGVPARSIKG